MYCLWMSSFFFCVGPCTVQHESLVGSKDTCTIKVKTVFAQKLVNSSREVSVYKRMYFLSWNCLGHCCSQLAKIPCMFTYSLTPWLKGAFKQTAFFSEELEEVIEARRSFALRQLMAVFRKHSLQYDLGFLRWSCSHSAGLAGSSSQPGEAGSDMRTVFQTAAHR